MSVVICLEMVARPEVFLGLPGLRFRGPYGCQGLELILIELNGQSYEIAVIPMVCIREVEAREKQITGLSTCLETQRGTIRVEDRWKCDRIRITFLPVSRSVDFEDQTSWTPADEVFRKRIVDTDDVAASIRLISLGSADQKISFQVSVVSQTCKHGGDLSRSNRSRESAPSDLASILVGVTEFGREATTIPGSPGFGIRQIAGSRQRDSGRFVVRDDSKERVVVAILRAEDNVAGIEHSRWPLTGSVLLGDCGDEMIWGRRVAKGIPAVSRYGECDGVIPAGSVLLGWAVPGETVTLIFVMNQGKDCLSVIRVNRVQPLATIEISRIGAVMRRNHGMTVEAEPVEVRSDHSVTEMIEGYQVYSTLLVPESSSRNVGHLLMCAGLLAPIEYNGFRADNAQPDCFFGFPEDDCGDQSEGYCQNSQTGNKGFSPACERSAGELSRRDERHIFSLPDEHRLAAEREWTPFLSGIVLERRPVWVAWQ